MNIPQVNFSFRKLRQTALSSEEKNGLLTLNYTLCPDETAEDSFPERFQLSTSALP